MEIQLSHKNSLTFDYVIKNNIKIYFIIQGNNHLSKSVYHEQYKHVIIEQLHECTKKIVV